MVREVDAVHGVDVLVGDSKPYLSKAGQCCRTIFVIRQDNEQSSVVAGVLAECSSALPGLAARTRECQFAPYKSLWIRLPPTEGGGYRFFENAVAARWDNAPYLTACGW